MIVRWVCRRHSAQRIAKPVYAKPHYKTFSASSRNYAQVKGSEAIAASTRTRNIGIIAHIDAGKTTTTERMLYYSGFTRRIGDVDEGSTVTDFLPAERARGITIQSAAITFSWPPSNGDSQHLVGDHAAPRSSIPHSINLIDTPGHADFTFEVLRSLRVLDGAVCILDGVAGVEAQTEKVWAQASAYAIPRIVFVNKLDRDGAAFGRTVREVAARLGVWPAVCSIPWWNSRGRLQGVADVVGLRGLRYAEGGDGKQIEVFDLDQLKSEDQNLAAELKRARAALIELLSENDDEIVEKYLEADEDYFAISPDDITESLRRCVRQHPQNLVPVFAGASFRNIGVQPLLDAIVDLLPSPEERRDPAISFGGDLKGGLNEFLAGELPPPSGANAKALSKDKSSVAIQNLEACALAFKVVADARRGVLVYVRVYSGSLHRNATLWNTHLQVTERCQRLLKMYANEAVEIDTIGAGQIGVIPGLKAARTGDTLISYTGANPKAGPPAPTNSLQLRPIEVPPPVFFVSVEPNSLSEEKHIRESLDILLREDPSLHVSLDEESGQTHLSGMGELHLEIARDRLVNDFKARARIGNVEIGYREALIAASEDVVETYDREVSGKSSKASCIASVEPASDDHQISDAEGHEHVFDLHDENRVVISTPTLFSDGAALDAETPSLPSHLDMRGVLQALENGVSAALARGPVHNYPIHSAKIKITFDTTEHLFPNTTLASLSSAARLAVQNALKDSSRASETILMEPVMLVTISVDEENVGAVVHDISSARGGSIVSLGSDDDEEQRQSVVDLNRIYTPPDPFSGERSTSEEVGMVSATMGMRQVVARVPLKEVVGYLKHLRSLTGGRGTFTMVVDQFEKMSAQRQRVVLNQMRGEYN